LYASISELIGYKLLEKEAPDSQAMWKTFTGESDKGRDFLLEESVTLSLRHGSYKYIHPTTKKAPWIREEKGIDGGISKLPQLYNLSNDIGETTNIAFKNKRLVRKMEKEIERIKTNEVTRK